MRRYILLFTLCNCFAFHSAVAATNLLIQVPAGGSGDTLESAKDWSFTGAIRERVDWQKEGTNWTTVFVKIDTENVLLDEIRLIYNPTNGVLDADGSRWMYKPMPDLKCPTKISALITAKQGKKCRLVFSATHWNLETKDNGHINLKSLEWIQSPDIALEPTATALSVSTNR